MVDPNRWFTNVLLMLQTSKLSPEFKLRVIRIAIDIAFPSAPKAH